MSSINQAERDDTCRADLAKFQFSGRTLAILTALAVPTISGDDTPGPQAPPPAVACAEGLPALPALREQTAPEALRPVAAVPESPGDCARRHSQPLPDSPHTAERRGEAQLHESHGRSRLWDIAIKTGVGVLAAFGAASALRGTIKMGAYIWNWYKDHRNFAAGRCLSAPSTNLHNMAIEHGLMVVERNTVHQPRLADIFRNSYAEAIFNRACNLCTAEQPFPHLNFVPATANWLERAVAACGLWSLPNQQALLREFNQLLTGYYSALQHEGAFRQDAGLPVTRDYHFIIPIVEVVPGKSRDLVFMVIAHANFRQFGDPQQVDCLLRDNPHLERRVRQLEKAYQLHTQFIQERATDAATEGIPAGHPVRNEFGATIFPWARIYEKVPRNGK